MTLLIHPFGYTLPTYNQIPFPSESAQERRMRMLQLGPRQQLPGGPGRRGGLLRPRDLPVRPLRLQRCA